MGFPVEGLTYLSAVYSANHSRSFLSRGGLEVGVSFGGSQREGSVG